jgi:hypothetical protein
MQSRYESEGIAPPEYFFSLDADCHKWQKGSFEKSKLYELPSFCKLWGEEEFAKVFMAWGEDALYFKVLVTQDEIKVSYPDVSKGDSVEIFIDTKNLKTAKLTHRFCHHFYFLPERIEGKECAEITRFRTEDVHTLAASDDLEMEVKSSKKGYSLEIVIPEKCLVGFQPEDSSAIGFTYRINRSNGSSQHFALSSTQAIDQHPDLWASVHLVK